MRLAAAYAEAGKIEVARQLIGRTGNSVLASGAWFTFQSRLRDKAMELETWLLAGQNDRALTLAQEVAAEFSATNCTTQEVAFVSAAMNRLAGVFGDAATEVVIRPEGGKAVSLREIKGIYSMAVHPSDGTLHTENRGKQEVHLSLTTRRQPQATEQLPAVAKGIQFDIRYTDANGREVSPERLAQGDEFYAEITVRKAAKEPRSIALTYAIPSGWEIWNERMVNEHSTELGDYTDIRDDRIIWYFGLKTGESRTFRVRLRAAYCGNSDMDRLREGKWVDIARAPRSSGSILKPLLYCAALQEGILLPQMLLPDVPTDFGGFAPKNFDGSYAGAVPADEALSLSLNVPNVHLLKEFGPMRFAELLKRAGLSSLNRPDNRYGLSLVLGGAEVRLLDIVQLYANMAAAYQHIGDSTRLAHFPFADRVALYATFEAMRNVNRPDQMDWRRATSTRQIAWKTGTSYGSRDGWAIGVTPEYAVGVWAGNANGSSAPGLTGARTAGPVLFDLFNLLPLTGWFAEPDATDGIEVMLCRHSGHIAGRNCTETVRTLVPKNALQSRACPYCQEIVAADNTGTPNSERRFVLPTVMEHYYRQTHSVYPSTTLATAQTVSRVEVQPMHFIYPTDGCVVSLPIQSDGTVAALNCSVAHTDPAVEIFWHLDNSYLGSTRNIHQFAVQPSPGCHTLTIVDTSGNSISINIVVV